MFFDMITNSRFPSVHPSRVWLLVFFICTAVIHGQVPEIEIERVPFQTECGNDKKNEIYNLTDILQTIRFASQQADQAVKPGPSNTYPDTYFPHIYHGHNTRGTGDNGVSAFL